LRWRLFNWACAAPTPNSITIATKKEVLQYLTFPPTFARERSDVASPISFRVVCVPSASRPFYSTLIRTCLLQATDQLAEDVGRANSLKASLLLTIQIVVKKNVPEISEWLRNAVVETVEK